MSGRSGSRSLVMRKRLPWLDSPEVSNRARPCKTEVEDLRTYQSFPRLDQLQTFDKSVDNRLPPVVCIDESSDNAGDQSTTQAEVLTIHCLPQPTVLAASSDGANSSSNLGNNRSAFGSGPSNARKLSEGGGRSALAPAPEGTANTVTFDLGDVDSIPAYKKNLIHMINNLLRSEPDLPSNDEPPPRDPRRLTGKLSPVEAAPKIATQSIEGPEHPNTLDHRHASVLSAPANVDQTPDRPQESPSPMYPSSQGKRQSLPRLPQHLMPSTDSSSLDDPSVDLSWTSSVSPDPEDVYMRGSLNRAVTGLENLMEEALNTARDAAKTGRSEDVATVLNNATLALRKASTIRGMMRKASSPLSSISSLDSRQTRSRSEISLDFDRRFSSDTLPTVFTQGTKSKKPSFVSEEQTREAYNPESQRAMFHDNDLDITDSSDDDSMVSTPPQLYQSTSVDSVARDFAYPERALKKSSRVNSLPQVENDVNSNDRQSWVPSSTSRAPTNAAVVLDVQASDMPHTDGMRSSDSLVDRSPHNNQTPDREESVLSPGTLQSVEPIPVGPLDAVRELRDRRLSHIAPDRSESLIDPHGPSIVLPPKTVNFRKRPSTIHELDPRSRDFARSNDNDSGGPNSTVTNENRYDDGPSTMLTENDYSKDQRYSDPSIALKTEDLSLRKPRRKHLSLAKGQKFSLGRYHKRRPIAREWSTRRKRITATITCLDTVFIGLIAGIYAGEVPRIQYQIADQHHLVLYGNVLLFAGLGITTLLFWPLPLLHGRKPYVSAAFVIMLPLQFPQALAIASYRDPRDSIYRFGLLFPRILTGMALGLANINFLPTLFDLYGASLMSKRPHQEIVVYDDVRRQGGGMGLWLGIWTFCFSSALAIGFCIGAGIIARLDPSWGFYIVVILLAFFLFINVMAPETRRSPYRRSIAHFYDEDDPEKLRRRVARGEVKLHISNDGPKWWFEEVWAGIVLTTRMIRQPGFFILMYYMGWIKAQLTLVILLLGALLSRDYRWRPEYVGLAVLAVPIGAIVALPLSKASYFSRSRSKPQRTDSMTFEPRLTWTSHLIQRVVFSLLLPLAALAYCLTAPGPHVHWSAPVIFAGLIGFLTDLGIAECVGLIMETFDTSDLQPGVNTRHRLVSLDPVARRRRTNYSSFPRVCAGFFAADALGFLLSAVATGVSGRITRAYGAQTAIAIVAGVLLAVTLCLFAALWRWREVQVVPNYTAGATLHGTAMWTGPGVSDPSWKPVVVGNPSGKMRRMNLLEMGGWSRWTEIRKLNGLIRA